MKAMGAVNGRSNSRTSAGKYELVLTNAFDWMSERRTNSVHAVVTDPPYGLVEYRPLELKKMKAGKGGIGRIPPNFGGSQRRPLPRFTVLKEADHRELERFFTRFASEAIRILVPGGHVFIATNPLLSHLVYLPMLKAGFEKRGEVIRLVQTLRGGDRPKNAHEEFASVTVMPRSQWEPWGLFRKPCQGRVQDNLRTWGTGGLRRVSDEEPFGDVIASTPTHAKERIICPHPSLKPQAFMRQIVHAALPLGSGVVLDPFAGGGSTLAAASAAGYQSIEIEINEEYFHMAYQAIPKLSELTVGEHRSGGRKRQIQSQGESSAMLGDWRKSPGD